MKKLLLSLIFLLVFASFVSAGFTTSPTTLTVSGQEDIILTRNIVITNTGNEKLNFGVLVTNGTFTDAQGDAVTFGTLPTIGIIVNGTDLSNPKTISITVNIADNVKIGTYTGTLKFAATGTTLPNPTFDMPISIRVDPKICKDGRVSDGNQVNNVDSGNLIIDVEDPDDGDNFGPGDKIKVTTGKNKILLEG